MCLIQYQKLYKHFISVLDLGFLIIYLMSFNCLHHVQVPGVAVEVCGGEDHVGGGVALVDAHHELGEQAPVEPRGAGHVLADLSSKLQVGLTNYTLL